MQVVIAVSYTHLDVYKRQVLDSALFCSFLFQLPTEMSSVYITGIRRTVCVRIILIGIIIELTNLISAVDNRNAGLNKQIGCLLYTSCLVWYFSEPPWDLAIPS